MNEKGCVHYEACDMWRRCFVGGGILTEDVCAACPLARKVEDESEPVYVVQVL